MFLRLSAVFSVVAAVTVFVANPVVHSSAPADVVADVRQFARQGPRYVDPAEVAGRVLDAVSRRPILGAIVTVDGRGTAQRLLTDASGRFEFRNLPAIPLSVTATKSGWADGHLGRSRPNGDGQSLVLSPRQRLADVEILMWRLGAIGGSIRDEVGEPVVGVQVRALLRGYRTGDPRWAAARIAVTNDRGEYRLGLLAPGEYTVVIPETHASYSADVAERVGDAVIMGGRAMVSAIPIGPGGTSGRPYAYHTTFYPNALTSSTATSMTIGPGTEIEGVDFHLVPVPTFVVSGRMRRDNASVSGPLTLLRAAPDARGQLRPISDIPVATSIADADGRFTFPTVPAGNVVLKSQDESQWAAVPVTLVDRDITDLDVALQATFLVKGRFVLEGLPSASQQALLRSQVRLEALDPRVGTTRQQRVDADLQFAVWGLAAGAYMVMVQSSDPALTVKAVTLAGRDVTDRAIDITTNLDVVVTFTNRSTELRGSVVGAERNAPSVVLVFQGGGFPLADLPWNGGARRFRRETVGADGSYSIRGLPAGDYLVAAIPEDQSDDWTSTSFLESLSSVATVLRLNEGETTRQDLQVLPVRR